MRYAPPALISLLGSASDFKMVDLLTISLMDGTTLRYSGGQTSITTGGHTFTIGTSFDRGGIRTVIGTEVDALDLDFYPNDANTIGSFTFIQAAWSGVFDGAEIRLERAFLTSWEDVDPDTIILFAGKVSDIECSPAHVAMTCRSHLELLSNQMPRRLYKSICGHNFGGEMCLFDRSSMAETFACSTGSTQIQIVVSLSPSPATLFSLGTLTGLDGANAGHRRTIVSYGGGSFALRRPFLYPVVTGDHFEALPGCDHTLATCTDTFSNDEHFGGFPHIPVAETAI